MEVKKIYELALENLSLNFQKYGDCCFCHALTSAVVMIEKGYSFDQVYEEGYDIFSETWKKVMVELTPEGAFFELYSYKPENTFNNSYWFDPKNYQVRQDILEKILQTVPS